MSEMPCNLVENKAGVPKHLLMERFRQFQGASTDINAAANNKRVSQLGSERGLQMMALVQLSINAGRLYDPALADIQRHNDEAVA